MKETVQSISSMVDARPQVDVTELYGDLWTLLGELHAKVTGRFELEVDPSSERFAEYGAPDGPAGSIVASSGPEVDWLVHSWLANPKFSFSNMHLTAWLGPHVRVPHLGIAFGSMPDIWFYIDYVPRSDLMVDLEALRTYYEPVNARWLELRGSGRVAPFVSQALYVRQALSDVAMCYSAPNTPETVALLREVAHEYVDRWLGWVEEAAVVPVEERAALADRDLAVRRNVAELDPANEMGVRYFGEEMTEALVRSLWGGDRVLPRPHER